MTAAADPYGDVSRQKAVLGRNLRDDRVIVIRILVRNDGDSPVLVRLTGITLKPPQGEELFPVQPQAATDLSRTSPPGMLFVWPDPIIMGLSLGLSLAEVAVKSGVEGTAYQESQDYRQKELSELTLPTGAEAHGFVFFRPLQGTRAFDEAVLNVRVIDLAALRTNMLSLPLTGINFRGWKD